MRMLAIVKNGKIIEVVRQTTQDVVRDCDVIVNVTERPDVKVGDKWPICTMAEYQRKLESEKGEI